MWWSQRFRKARCGSRLTRPANSSNSIPTWFKILRYQYSKGYASRLDAVAQELLVLAQITATLPPLIKQSAQLRDQLAGPGRTVSKSAAGGKIRAFEPATAGGIAAEPAVAIGGSASGCPAGRGKPACRQRGDRHRNRKPSAQHRIDRQCRQHRPVQLTRCSRQARAFGV